MRLNVRAIVTAVLAVLCLSALNLHAMGAIRPSSGDDNASDPSLAAIDDSSAQAPAASKSRSLSYAANAEFGNPKLELFLGYSYLRAVPTLADGNRLVWLNGGSTSLAYNLNRHWGLVADFGGFADSQLRLSSTGASTSTVADSSGNAFTYLLGPRLSFRGHGRFTPFAQVLFGGVHASPVTLSGCAGANCIFLPSQNSFALTAGGGLDVGLSRHLALRIVQAEYMMTRFDNLNTASGANQNDLRLSTGIVFRFGGSTHSVLTPASPLSYSCSLRPATVFTGERIAVSGTALNLNPSRTPVYTWSADGGTIAGVMDTAHIDTTGAIAGAYTANGHVSEGDKPGENADCTAPYVIKAYEPPTVSCSASPSSVIAGDLSTITAVGISPQNRPLCYSFSPVSGTVRNTGATAELSTQGAPLGALTVTCAVVDDKNQTASSTTSVTIVAAPIKPKPQTSNLCAIRFDRDARRPARVDNEGKACLDDIALNLQRTSETHLALTGNASSQEKGSKKLAAERAIHVKAYLVSDKGIDGVAPLAETNS